MKVRRKTKRCPVLRLGEPELFVVLSYLDTPKICPSRGRRRVEALRCVYANNAVAGPYSRSELENERSRYATRTCKADLGKGSAVHRRSGCRMLLERRLDGDCGKRQLSVAARPRNQTLKARPSKDCRAFHWYPPDTAPGCLSAGRELNCRHRAGAPTRGKRSAP